ncbi:MAG: hypothetical protein HY866_00885 [Chloroflexi bacterium]|nr:hypothetical protein [Chloroflexota bacterium]
MKLSIEGDRIIIEPAARPTLDDLLGGITPDNLHTETDWGEAAGQEIIMPVVLEKLDTLLRVSA